MSLISQIGARYLKKSFKGWVHRWGYCTREIFVSKTAGRPLLLAFWVLKIFDKTLTTNIFILFTMFKIFSKSILIIYLIIILTQPPEFWYLENQIPRVSRKLTKSKKDIAHSFVYYKGPIVYSNIMLVILKSRLIDTLLLVLFPYELFNNFFKI